MSFNLWAVVLAGGAGSRMGATGRQIPKIYLPIGLEPVLNRPVQACLEQIGQDGRVIVLTRRSHPDLDAVNMESWAEGWKATHAPDPRVEVWYEEDAAQTAGWNVPGACVGLTAFLELLGKKGLQPEKMPTHFLVIAGDNYFEGHLDNLVSAAQDFPEAGVISVTTIDDPAQAVRRFGVVQIDATPPPQSVTAYQEKPDEPMGTTITLGIYCLPRAHLEAVKPYVEGLLGNKRPAPNARAQSAKKSVGAPGYFIQHLFDRTFPLRARPLECIWFDVGTETAYLTSMIQYTTQLLRQPRSARELVAMGDAGSLTDKTFFLCNKVRVDPAQRHIILEIYGTDPVAVLSAETAIGGVRGLQQVLDDNARNNRAFWDSLEGNKGAGGAGPPWSQDLSSPILIAGGVILLDQPNPMGWAPQAARVPLLLRDISAPADPLRLTTPAGRMDKLDIAQVCISELAEEMVFFGGDSGYQVQIIAPVGYESMAIDAVLKPLLSSHVAVPGLDLAVLKAEYKAERRAASVPTTYRTVATAFVDPPPPMQTWTVQVRYKADARATDWAIESVARQFLLIPDRNAAVIELRLFVAANLTGALAFPPQFNPDDLSLGKLRGVVDGDGYGRPVLFVSYQDLKRYVRAMADGCGNALIRSDPHGNALPVIAMTDGRTGRFRRLANDYRLSVAALTTTVSKVFG